MMSDQQREELKRKLADIFDPALIASINRFSLHYESLRDAYAALTAWIDAEL